jgi:hypothetical protein
MPNTLEVLKKPETVKLAKARLQMMSEGISHRRLRILRPDKPVIAHRVHQGT